MTVEEIRKAYTKERDEGIKKNGTGYVKNLTKDEAAKILYDYISTFPFNYETGMHGKDGVSSLCSAVNCDFTVVMLHTPIETPDFSGMTLDDVQEVIRAFVREELDAFMATDDNSEEYERLIAIYWAIRTYRKFFKSTLSNNTLKMFESKLNERLRFEDVECIKPNRDLVKPNLVSFMFRPFN